MNALIDTSQLTEKPSWPEANIEEIVFFALEQMEAPQNCEVSVTLVDTPRIAELNAEFRGIDRPTDVLSFPCDDPWEEGAEEADELMIGDIVIAPAVCAAQAPTYGNTFDEEMCMLFVHSVLHLLGYDHIEDEDAEEMQAEERRIITAWRAHKGLPEREDVLGYARAGQEADHA
jgi:probable rRNA maturation factor